ncbi:MAG: cell wall hydrolase [Eubacterium sp.]|nr:cell wall hydrolase [Eubacterium sp.]
MRKIRDIKKYIAILLFFAILIACPLSRVTADPDTTSDTTDTTADPDTASSTDAIDYDPTLKKKKQDLERQAEASRNTVAAMMEQIMEINDRISDTSAEIEDLKNDMALLDLEIEKSRDELEEAEEDIKAERRILGETLRMIYESSESDDTMSVVMRADDEYDLINREEYIDGFSEYINNKLEDLQARLDEKTEKSDALENLKTEKENELYECEKKQNKLAKEMSELATVMEEAEEKAENAERFAEELAEEVAILEAKEREILGSRSYRGEYSNVVYDGDGSTYYYKEAYPYTDEELLILASIIQAEAGSTSYPGMIAVGSVVMNRVEDSRFPNTVAGVVYAPYQFEPVSVGTFAVIMARGPATSCYQAAQEVLEGKRNVPNFYFKAAWYAEAHGIEGINIGGNVFH